MRSGQPTSVDVALAALDCLGGANRFVDIEELTLEAYRLGPQFFRWRTRRDYPSPEKVRMALVHANEDAQKRGAEPLVISNAKGLGWRLTAAGIAFVSERASPAVMGSGRARPSLSSPSVRRVREIRRHGTFQRFVRGTVVGDMERYELADMLRCPPDSPAAVVMRKVDAACAAALDVEAKDVERFLGEVKREVGRKWT